jgi:NADPH2:quinone reductase
MAEAGLMRAVGVSDGGGGAEALYLDTGPVARPASGEFLIEVHAAALNHADLYQRDGEFPAPPGAPDILGVEAAGFVASPDPTGSFKVGTPVMGLLAGGGYAEYASVDPGLAAEIPAKIDFASAAALPEALIVGHTNLVELGRIREGSRVLIHGGASGMGSMMIQMAADMGALVATSVSDLAKAPRLKDLGAAIVLDRCGADFVAAASDWCEEAGFDLIVDIAGASTLRQNVELLGEKGALNLMGVLSGTVTEVDLDPIILKRLEIRGTILRPTPIEEKRRLAARAYSHWLPRVAAGAIRPVVDSVHRLEDVRAAHSRLESGRHVGKIVLAVRDGENRNHAVRRVGQTR